MFQMCTTWTAISSGACCNQTQRASALIITTDCQSRAHGPVAEFYDALTSRVCRRPNNTLRGEDERAAVHAGLDFNP